MRGSSLEVAGHAFWDALDRLGGSETCWGHAFGLLAGPWGSLGVLWVYLGRSLDVLGSPGRFLGWSSVALGVVLEVWGDHWVSPGN